MSTNQRVSLLLALGTLVLIGVFASTANAQGIEIKNPLKSTSFQQIVCSVVRFANSLLAPLSTLMVLIGGFFYMTGGENPEKIKTAHKIIIWALVGIAVVLLANSAAIIVKELLGGPGITPC